MKGTLSRILIISFIVVICLSSLPILNVKAQPKTITVPEDYQTIQEAIEAAKIVKLAKRAKPDLFVAAYICGCGGRRGGRLSAPQRASFSRLLT